MQGNPSALDWLTFVAALLAAVGTVIGPFLAYRASMRTIQADHQAAETARTEENVNRLVEQATGTNDIASSYAVAQLDYLLCTHRLTQEQTEAAQNAVGAVVSSLKPPAAPGTAVARGEGLTAAARTGDQPAPRTQVAASDDPVRVSSVDVQRAELLVRLNEALGRSSESYVRRIAAAPRADGPTTNPTTPSGTPD